MKTSPDQWSSLENSMDETYRLALQKMHDDLVLEEQLSGDIPKIQTLFQNLLGAIVMNGSSTDPNFLEFIKQRFLFIFGDTTTGIIDMYTD